jgi:hypothetical protein
MTGIAPLIIFFHNAQRNLGISIFGIYGTLLDPKDKLTLPVANAKFAHTH